MHRLKTICAVLGFVLVSLVVLPLVVFDFNASTEDFMIVTVYDGDNIQQYESVALTVGEFLQVLGFIANEYDRINYPNDFPLYEGMVLQIIREVAFYVTVDSGTPLHKTAPGGTTVETILDRMQETNGAVLLYANSVMREIESHDVLHFLSWRSRYFIETEDIPYEIIENRTGAIRYGRTYKRQAGVPGERETTTTVTYLGGEEASRVISHEVILTEPIATIYDIGIAPLGALTDTSAPEFRYVRRIRMQATAYCACVRCTGRQPGDRGFGITASGRPVEHGIVAVDRTVIPLGTYLYVSNHGFSVAADVGGAIRGYKIDLFMYDHEDARQFGRRYIYVYVLE